MSVSRNDPCPCGSGKKYKHCCLRKGGPESQQRAKRALWACIAVGVAALVVALLFTKTAGVVTALGGMGLVGGYYLFSNPPPPKAGGDPGAINFGG